LYQVNAVEPTERRGRLEGIRAKLIRRSTAVASALLVGAATGAVLFAAPASAHSTAVTGATTCLKDTGKWEVTWTLTNDYDVKATITNLTSNPEVTPKPIDIPAKKDGVNGEVKVKVTVENAVKTATISFTSEWGTRGKGGFYEDTDNKSSVDIPADCKAPTTPPTTPPVETVTTPPVIHTTPVVPAAPQLPVTGDRTWMLAVGGIAVLAIGVLLVVLVPRHRRARAVS
jgi:hypothetical protein